MFFDFSFYLLLVVALLAVVLAAWRLFRHFRPGWPTPVFVVYGRELFPLLLIVFLLRGFILEPFRIPSGSMLPNLQAGDLILVTKYNYGIRLPVSNRVLIPLGRPERGDIVVFYHPEKTDLHYIKRVIGLPGDRVRTEAGQVFVNDQLLALPPPPGGASEYEYDAHTAVAVQQARQSIAELMPQEYPQLDFRVESGERGQKWITMHHRRALDLSQDMSVPEGHYFVLGDNRDRSNDSRFWGFVPDHHVAGKAHFIWLHLDWRFWTRIGSIDPIQATYQHPRAGSVEPISERRHPFAPSVLSMGAPSPSSLAPGRAGIDRGIRGVRKN